MKNNRNLKNFIKVQPANNQDIEDSKRLTNPNYESVEENLMNKLLPKELILRIFSYLDVVTLCRCATVSKYWNTLALDGINWQYVDLFDFQTDIKGSVVENLSRRCGSFLKNMSLENCKWISDDAIKKLCLNCKNIEILNFKQCLKLTDLTCIYISKYLHNLKSVNFDSCNISDNGIKALCENCHSLESIDISHCRNISSEGVSILAKNCSKLKYFVSKYLTVIIDSSFKQLVQNCSNLQHVSLQNCHNLTDDSLTALANNCHNLQFLCISNCKHLTDSTLQALGKNCPKLKILEASGCSFFSDNGFIPLSKGCHLLERMDLEECNRITDSTLQNLSLNCPSLRHLTLSRCEFITDEGIKLISSSNCASESLQVLELDNCPLITDLSLEQLYQCQGLTKVELYDCQLITKSGIKRLENKLPKVKVHAYFAPNAISTNQRPSRSCSCRCCNIL